MPPTRITHPHQKLVLVHNQLLDLRPGLALRHASQRSYALPHAMLPRILDTPKPLADISRSLLLCCNFVIIGWTRDREDSRKLRTTGVLRPRLHSG